VKLKATCHITRQASIYAIKRLGSVPILNSPEYSPTNEGWKPPNHIKNRRQNVISFNQPRDMSAKMDADGISTHARTNQRHTLA